MTSFLKWLEYLRINASLVTTIPELNYCCCVLLCAGSRGNAFFQLGEGNSNPTLSLCPQPRAKLVLMMSGDRY